MQQVAQNYRSGQLAVLDVPLPSCRPGGLLVRTLYSLISTGTELMKVNESKMSLLGKARSRPEQVAKVLETAAQQGPVSAYRKTISRLDSYTPLGYSLAGIVIEVGRGAEEFSVGQVVACAGNDFALHAEVNWVPRNLCVPVPDGVPATAAAFSTVGAIAMQGLRQAEPQLGDITCVIGLGLVGQLLVQLLVAAGTRVVGLDVVPERCSLAEAAGALVAAAPDDDGIRQVEGRLAGISAGRGADQVFLVAGGSDSSPVQLAARLARDRATIVDIGKCKLDLPWNAYYEKELDLRFSRSYGPGRYDPIYEMDGVDYPAGYVRWTERRNMQCFLDLVSARAVDPGPLVSGVFPIGEAESVYDRLSAGSLPGVGFLFDYPAREALPQAQGPAPRPAAVARPGAPLAPRTGELRVGFIGAGNYASSMLLPHLAGMDGVRLATVVTNRSLSAVNAQKKFGFESTSTDPDSVLDDKTVTAVFVVTRHSSHADLVCRALEAGKQVFVEKPLALGVEELDRILATVAATGNDRLMVGFNRRFAPLLTTLGAQLGPVTEGAMLRYLVNAGPLPADSWYADEQGEGSRFVGEGGHFIDTASSILSSEPVEVSALGTGHAQDVQVVVRYANQSLATISYTTGGHPRFPKETLDVSVGRRSAQLANFRKVSVWTGSRRRVSRVFTAPDKGQWAQLQAFVHAVRSGQAMPISLASLASTTRATLAVPTSLASGQPEKV